MTRRKLGMLLVGVLAVSAVAATAASARQNKSRVQDVAAIDAHPVMAGVQITPLLTVGDALNSGYRFESIPDGIAVRTRGQGRVDLFVNHETSKAPFPFTSCGEPRRRPTARTTSTTRR